MEDLISQTVATLQAMWRRRWLGLAVAWGAAALGMVALLQLPDRFEANARVFVDTKSVLKPLMRDLAVEPDLDQTLTMLARTMISRPNVERLVSEGNLMAGAMAPLDRERMVEALLRDIKVTGSGKDNVFTFSYRDTDAIRARLVVSKLVSLFVESDLGAKARDAEAARDFIDQQVKAYEVRLTEAEERLKNFKVRNLGLADSSGKDYFARMAALTDELAKTNLELRAAEQSRDALRRELSGESTSLLPEMPAGADVAPSSPELDARIDAQRRQLDELLRRYTDLHPDVMSTRRLIAKLEEQRQQEAEARQRAELAKPQRATASPVSQQIKLALAESEANVAALRVRASDLQGRANELRSSATRVPQVEAELAQLNRDYEIIRRNYEAMVGKREKASLSEEVDATRLANFRVIEPPRSAPTPVFPSRLALAPLVLLMALVAGAAASFLAAQLWPTFSSTALLRSVTQRAVLGSVSMLVQGPQLRRIRLNAVAFTMGAVGLLAVYGAWIAWMSRAISTI